MKKIDVLISFVVLLMFFLSCEKRTIPEGYYSFTFKNYGSNLTARLSHSQVVESTRDYIVIKPYKDTLYKDGKNITGILTFYGVVPGMGNTRYGPFHITGVCDKKKGKHYISGDFVSKSVIINIQEGVITRDTTNISGTFEFKQFFME